MWLWRNIEGIRWQDRLTNEEGFNKDGEKKSITNIIARRRKNWFQHVSRRNNLLKELIDGRLCKKEEKGKTKTKNARFHNGKKDFTQK